MTRSQALDLATLVFKDQDLGDARRANLFFREYGVGNTMDEPNSPYERLTYYRDLLRRLREADENKFKSIHKGTPLYFLSWLAFDLHQFEAALQFIDAAIEEDKRNAPETWPGLPGPQLLMLNAKGQAAERTVVELAERVAKELDRFSGRYGVIFQLSDFLRRFAWPLLTTGGSAIIAGFYAFLLEFDDRLVEVHLRSDPRRGSYQPLFIHLFKGGLLLESLLKYAVKDLARLQLGDILQSPQFDTKIGLNPQGLGGNIPIAQICKGAAVGTPQSAFQTTGRLRNTMGHNLILEPLLPDQYRDLVMEELNAFLYAAVKLYP